MSDSPLGSGGPAEPPLSDWSGDDLPPLDPDLAAWFAAAPSPTMPPEVWDRLEAALAAEPAFTASGAAVVDLAQERQRRRPKVLPILAGAAGLVLVGAVVIPAMRGGDGPAPVADAPAGGAASAGVALPAESSDVASPRAAAMPRMMMSTGTQYASTAMPDQVGSLLATAGITDATAVANLSEEQPPATVETVGTEGFTATAETVEDCLERLGMTSADTPALVIDRATYDGTDAAVIVAVKTMTDPAAQPAMLDVVIVGSQCSEEDVAAAQHFEYAVAP